MFSLWWLNLKLSRWHDDARRTTGSKPIEVKYKKMQLCRTTVHRYITHRSLVHPKYCCVKTNWPWAGGASMPHMLTLRNSKRSIKKIILKNWLWHEVHFTLTVNLSQPCHWVSARTDFPKWEAAISGVLHSTFPILSSLNMHWLHILPISMFGSLDRGLLQICLPNLTA